MNSEVREQLFIREPLGTWLQEGEERHHQAPPPPSVLRGALQSGQQWLPVMAATPGSWMAGGRWRCVPSLGGRLPQQGCGQASGSRVGHLHPPASPSPCTSILPLSFPRRCPWCRPTKKWEEAGGRGSQGAFAWRSGGQCFPCTPGQPRTSLCSGVAGLPSIAKELLLKNSNSKGIRPVWERNKGIYFCKHETKIRMRV